MKRMQQLPVYAIEGVSGVGKTTLLSNLKFQGISGINEYTTYARGHQNFPKESGTSKAIKAFINWEKQRSFTAKKLAKHSIVIMDRSPLSVIVFDYALNQDSTAFIRVAKAFQKAWEEGEIIMPMGFIFIRVPPKTIVERLSNTNFKLKIFLDERIIEMMQEFYVFYFKNCINPKLVLHLDGTSNPQIQALNVAKFLENKEQHLIRNDGFLRLIEEEKSFRELRKKY
jgi:thymidylate kinase